MALYSRDLGGIKSDGQLYGMGPQSVPLGTENRTEVPETHREAPEKEVLSPQSAEKPIWDDLLLPAIALLLLSDEHRNDDLLLLLVGMLLLF